MKKFENQKKVKNFNRIVKMNNPISHYNLTYFENYQKKMGLFGGISNLFLFEKHIKEKDVVLDFGCGGGFLLENLNCKKKIGIEINEISRNYCLSQGIDCYEKIDSIDDESVDVIISSHCLEHTTSPYENLEKIYAKLKLGGSLIVVVPTDSYKVKYKPNDLNNHLYSFSPMNLGNLICSVGFDILEIKPIFHKWPPYYLQIKNLLGWRIFHFISILYGYMSRSNVQIKAIAKK